MTLMNRAVHAIVGATIGCLALLAVLATPAGAQVGKLVDPNKAAESELTALPHMTPAIVKGMIEKRPFKTVVELNKFLLEQKLTQDQAKEFYGKAFVPINLNTGTKEEFLLIPRVGARMSAEFEEYRPWKTWNQFDKEIGKYVGQPETDRLKQYFFIPTS
jgi:DNA uptake protein ComE-like DNA-binding protein